MSPTPSYHAWTHRPKRLGGTDPLEDITHIASVRGFTAPITVTSGTWTTLTGWNNTFDQGPENIIDVTATGTKALKIYESAVFALSGVVEWGAAFTATRRIRVGPSGSLFPEGSGLLEFDLGEEGNNNTWGATFMSNFSGLTPETLTFEVWQDSGSSQSCTGDTSVLLVRIGLIEL